MTKLSRIFDFTPQKELAVKLAVHLEKNLPPKLMNRDRNILSANKITRVLEQAFEQAMDYNLQAGMGIIKRAALANSLKWELRNRGFRDDFISVVTEGLVVTLSRKKVAK